MIKDLAAYHRLRVDEDRKALQAMDLEASIAIAEALLTSSIMDVGAPRPGPRPPSLARGLGISPSRLARVARPGR
ncbi:MAG: hypothetical protein ABL886_12945 [Rhodoglobus sp.]